MRDLKNHVIPRSFVRVAVGLLVASWMLSSEALAEPPVGAFALNLSGADAVFLPPRQRIVPPVVDVVVDGLRATGKCGKVKVGLDGNGATNCKIAVRDGKVRVELEGKLRLDLDTKSGESRVSVKLAMDGEIRAGSDRADLTLSGKGKVGVAPSSTAIFVSLSLKLCAEAGGARECVKQSATVGVELGPAGGSWSLDLATATKGKEKLEGSATVTVGGRSVEYKVSGRLNSRTGLYRLKLKPKKGKGARIQIVDVSVVGDQLTGTVTYQIYGQSGTSAPLTVTITPAG